MKRTPKTGIFFVSLVVAIGVAALIPTPNNTNGGTAKMLFIIFATVLIKVVIEWAWRRVFTK